MGSLMAGWNSPVLGDDKKVRLMRNRSLTNEAVDDFWRHNQKPPEMIIRSPLASPRATSQQESRLPSPMTRSTTATTMIGRDDPCLRSTRSEPLSRSYQCFFPEDGAGESSSPSHDCWWTRSSWAFLNEPAPEKEDDEEKNGMLGKAQTYAGGHSHVARIVTGNVA